MYFWSSAVKVASFLQLQHLYSLSSYFDVKKNETDRLLSSDHWRGFAGMMDLRRTGMAKVCCVNDALDKSQMHAQPDHRLGRGANDRLQHAWPKDSPPLLESGAVMVVLLVTNY